MLLLRWRNAAAQTHSDARCGGEDEKRRQTSNHGYTYMLTEERTASEGRTGSMSAASHAQEAPSGAGKLRDRPGAVRWSLPLPAKGEEVWVSPLAGPPSTKGRTHLAPAQSTRQHVVALRWPTGTAWWRKGHERRAGPTIISDRSISKPPSSTRPPSHWPLPHGLHRRQLPLLTAAVKGGPRPMPGAPDTRARRGNILWKYPGVDNRPCQAWTPAPPPSGRAHPHASRFGYNAQNEAGERAETQLRNSLPVWQRQRRVGHLPQSLEGRETWARHADGSCRKGMPPAPPSAARNILLRRQEAIAHCFDCPIGHLECGEPNAS
jgi:hypothetical protein